MSSVNKDKSQKITTALQFIAITVCLVLLCSSWSFNIADKPSSFVYPPNEQASNWCGSAGAFAAYYLLYYIGEGIYICLISAICFLIASLMGEVLTQPILRSVGLALLCSAFSTSFFLIWPQSANSFPMGNGGIFGVATGSFLRSQFAPLGTFFILACCWVVGAILLADNFVIAMLHNLGVFLARLFGFAAPAARETSGAIGEIWQKLSARQRQDAQDDDAIEAIETIPAQSATAKSDDQIDQDLDDLSESVDEESESDSPAPAHNVNKIKLTLPQIHKPAQPYVPKTYDDYTLPPLDLLAEPEFGYAQNQEKVIKTKASELEKLLSEFNINAHIVAAETGPVITMFELELGSGIKVNQIINLSNDMARALGAAAVRVVAPLPGKHTIGIEVPNNEKEKVRIKDLITLAGNRPDKMNVPLFLGKDSSGEALVTDLTAMPHLLIAGTTGSGKSVCINTIITSVLLTKRPDEVKLVLIDPKMVEMTAFSSIPHLMCPIVTETKRAEQILEWATVKMDERYALLAEAGVKNIASYNKLTLDELIARFKPQSQEEEAKIPKKLPYIVIIVDELADLMMTSGKEIEAFIVRLAQKSRAIGIHIILATQRPQATVVTGLIKSNMPCRVSFRVAARMDSRIVLDQNGAETLLGQGDMLYLQPGTSELRRAQGAYLDDNEIRGIVQHLGSVAEPQFHPELVQMNKVDPSEMSKDEMFDDAVRIVLGSKRGSVSLLQRKLSIGYARASRIIEMMAAAGILGDYKGSQAREVLMSLEEYESVREQMMRDSAAGYSDMNEDKMDSPTQVIEEDEEEIASKED